MSEHTPGPWRYEPEDPNYRDAAFMVWGPKGPGHGLVAHTSPHGIPAYAEEREQKAADARLIAALMVSERSQVSDPKRLAEIKDASWEWRDDWSADAFAWLLDEIDRLTGGSPGEEKER